MTVKELIELLENEDPTLQVFMSSDSEGNSYQLVDKGFGESPYYRDGSYFEPVEPEDVEDGEYEDEDLKIGLFIYPGYPLADYPE